MGGGGRNAAPRFLPGGRHPLKPLTEKRPSGRMDLATFFFFQGGEGMDKWLEVTVETTDRDMETLDRKSTRLNSSHS